jgi:hypothetical protein
MATLKMDDAIAKAIDERNARLAGIVANSLRFKGGMNYEQVLARVQKVRPNVTAEDWECLMYEADCITDE